MARQLLFRELPKYELASEDLATQRSAITVLDYDTVDQVPPAR